MNVTSDHPDNGVVGAVAADGVISAEADMSDLLRQLRVRKMQSETNALPVDDESAPAETALATVAEDVLEAAEPNSLMPRSPKSANSPPSLPRFPRKMPRS